MTIYLGSDHRGFKLKEKIKTWLEEWGYSYEDCGNSVYDPKDDYPDFAIPVAQKVTALTDSRGIVICGSGIGVTMAANKVKGALCGMGMTPEQVRSGAEHDAINVLALSADHSSEQDVKAMIKAFLETEYSKEERHMRRVRKVRRVEHARDARS